ncbi:hypothetical protein E8E11_003335 [Didymella keratinophila]|nr:hypothetical protein E8E11_003335 [Didymella keratinophila]
MDADNGYESVLSARARVHRRQRDVRKRREQLAKQKLQFSSEPILRSLKGAARKQLVKERAPTLWILAADIDFRRSHCSGHLKASLLGLPAELRQEIPPLSFEVEEMVSYQPSRSHEKPRCFRAKKASVVSRKLDRQQRIMDKLNSRVSELCQVDRIISGDLCIAGRHWQRAIESLSDRTIDLAALEFPDFAKPVFTVIYESKRKKSKVIKGDDRPLKSKRLGKCWYCTERHDRSGCTRATEDPQKWLRDTKAVAGWRLRAHTKPSFQFQVKKIVFND